MNKIKTVWMLLAGLVLATACKNVATKKTPGGMPYKLYRSKDTLRVQAGNYLKLSVTQKINDSVAFTTKDGLPIYMMAGAQGRSYDISELWTSLHRGDSVVTTQMMDTFIRRSPESVPRQFRNGDRIITQVKILAIFPNDSLAKIDEKKMVDQMMAVEIGVVEKYLADKKINAVKTPSGAFLEITRAGTGPQPQKGNYVTVNYTGSNFAGVKFDSNTDSTFGHVAPFAYTAGIGQMIRGFDEAVLLMKQGAKGRAYIPSFLAYGREGSPPRIKPFENLIFDLELVKVEEKGPDQTPPPAPH